MENLLRTHFDFEKVTIKKLNGYSNANYMVIADEQRFIFKTYVFDEQMLEQVSAETEILLFLSETPNTLFPSPKAFAEGSFVKKLPVGGEHLICRMLSYLDGEFLGNVVPSESLFTSFGRFLAEMNVKLKAVKNATLKSRELAWDLNQFHLNKPYISAIEDPHDRNIVRYFFQAYDQRVVPVLPELRKCIIHNDANEWNILVKDDRVSGVIDFGDMVYSSLINEVAIAITYGCYDKDNPLEWSRAILKGYHEIVALEEKELDVLYYLIAARLCTSVCQSAHARKQDPSNEYASVSEKSAWKMLRKWLSIGPIQAVNCFYSAAGLSLPEVDSVDEIKERRHQSVSPILSISYSEAIYMKQAAFQYMYDGYGNAFLDSYNNIPHVGHCHPQVVEAGQRQIATLNTNTRYLYDQLAEYAEQLLSKFPSPLNKVFFVNSGSAASDLAMRLARTHTQKDQVMVMEHGYHGNTQTSIDISDYKFSNPKGQGQKEHVIKTPLPNAYNGKYRGEHAGSAYGKDAVDQIAHAEDTIAAFVSEPIVGCGGQVPLAAGYLKEVYPAIRKQGGVCISDEVQTGFGRLGDYFWGFEAHNVVPDIVILGKPIANGHPMGAVVCTEEVAASFGHGVEFFSSFGGNPVSCEIAKSVLHVIEEESLQQHAKSVGDFYISELRSLQKKFPCIGDVRGSGLFIGVEIVKPGSFETDQKIAHQLKNELRRNFILISTDGPDDSVLKMKPPLCFNKENVKEVIDKLESILEKQKS
ncbi:MAG: aminotransferase class III-fold pyridoxal phosphate-dependent enzyme [Ekhidna sp.]